MSDSTAQTWDEKYIWRASLPLRTAWLLAFVTLFTFAPMLVDRWVYDHWFIDKLYDRDWARLLREMGWFPTWAIASLALWLAQRHAGEPTAARAKANALLLFAAPAVSGIVCEVLKLLIRRERPETNGGEYGFRQWDDQPFSTAGLALPSSHTMVAFAACTALARIFPGARGVWYVLAWGCAVTRVLARAHFVSDIALGALLGWSVGWGVWIAMRRGEKSAP
jgi:membrane-associated phospholipid phosphatase